MDPNIKQLLRQHRKESNSVITSEQSFRCPHCERDLTGDWLSSSAEWVDGELVEEKIDCPHCGKDITDGLGNLAP